MSDETTDDGLRARLSRQGEEALGRLAQELLDNGLVTGALQRGLEAREKASQAQEAAMGALNLPSAADLERLTRRVRSVGQRLEGIEDGVDRLADRVGGASGSEQRLAALEQRLSSLDEAIAEVAAAIAALSPSAEAGAAKPKARAAAKTAASSKRTPKPPG
jgi:hypothetical protein